MRPIPLLIVSCAVVAGAAGLAALSVPRQRPEPGMAPSVTPRADPAPTRAAEVPAPAAESPPRKALKATLERLLEITRQQESGKDATCWTTVRMMDAHFAGRAMPDGVGILKIEACKTLVYQVWRKASAKKPGDAAAPLDVTDLLAVVPSEVATAATLMAAADPSFGSDPIASVRHRDYDRITENKRYLHAIAAEALSGSGLFDGRPLDLRPLSDDAIRALSAVATLLTTDMLDRIGASASTHGHETIEPEDVQEAFAGASRALGTATDETTQPAGTVEADASALPIDGELLGLTRRIIDGKIAALRSWNAKLWKDVAQPATREAELVGRFSQVPFDALGYAAFRQRLRAYAQYVPLGTQPVSMSRFLAASSRAQPETRETAAGRPGYITLPWAALAMENLFPRSIAANGDVTVILVDYGSAEAAAAAATGGADHPSPAPSPASAVPPRPTHEIRLLDWELDAVRDTTIHWSVIRDAWATRDARPADPFALELLADRMSEITLLLLRECESEALRLRSPTITPEICNHALKDVNLAPPEPAPPSWKAEELERKARVLAPYARPFFSDGSADAGFPAAGALARPDLGAGPGAAPAVLPPLIDFMGCGAAVGDVDGDGLPDLFLAGDGGNRLLRNLGGHRFEDATARLGIDDTRCDDAHHALFVDYDNDGRLDLMVIHASSASRLFHQEADGQFTDATAACGMRFNPAGHAAVWFDYDNDGLLDCYVGNYGRENTPSLDGRNGVANQLFHNLGGGRFADVTAQAGVGSTGWALACAAIDVDHDGWMDLFVANDYGRSELFINRGDGTFSEAGRRFGVDDRGSSMDASVVDIDNDGWMDIYISQVDMFSKSIGFVFPEAASTIDINDRILRSTFSIAGNKLFRNGEGKRFTPVQKSMFEPGDRGWSWSANFFDYDNDGDDDMYLSNGWIRGTAESDQANQLFIREGGTFYLAGGDGPESYRGNSRGVVAADLTASGHVDLVLDDYGSPPRLLVNRSADANHWLKVRLHGARSNRAGIGAVVELVKGGALPPQWKQVSCGSNYLSQDETILTFGIGQLESAERIVVTWPGNHEQTVTGPFAAGAVVEVVEEIDGTK